jgi:ABC-type amino acid transport system permease subunit
VERSSCGRDRDPLAFSGAYIAEIIRAGIESVGRSQWDSARAIGLTTVQTYRFVIFPQVLRQILPPVAGQFSSLIKDSSLLYIIGIPGAHLYGESGEFRHLQHF